MEFSKGCIPVSNKELDNRLCSLSAFHPSVEYSLNVFFLHFIPLMSELKE